MSVRVPREMFAEIEAEIVSQNASRPVQPYDRAAWVLQAIKERLAKLKRGRNKGRAVREACEPAGDQGEGDQLPAG